MLESTVITICTIAIGLIFRWAAYRYMLPNIKIVIKVENDTSGYVKIDITACNSGGRNASIDADGSFLLLQNPPKKIDKKFNLNLVDLSTGSYEDVILNNGKKLVSSFRFNQYVKIVSVSIKDNFTGLSWSATSKNLMEINKFLLNFFSSR